MLEVVLGSSTANNTQFICFRITFCLANVRLLPVELRPSSAQPHVCATARAIQLQLQFTGSSNTQNYSKLINIASHLGLRTSVLSLTFGAHAQRGLQ